MISIAGVIGAGLFVGSASAIASAGPGVLIAYVIAGTLVVLVMRMLGEMAAAQPDSGSFSTYANRAIGRWAGFTVGWLYWWFWVLVIPVEATAAAAILNAWMPALPLWAWALAVTLVLTITNLFSVANYGEFEFWFALLKVVAIVAFIGVGLLAIFGVLPDSGVSGVSHLFDTGGFLPNGFGAVIIAVLTTMFSFMGTEIVTIAAAESDHPAVKIGRATRSVIWRIAVFYLASILLVVAIVPWNSPQLRRDGSYQSALDAIGIPSAKVIVDIVVLVAVASCLNSALYTASRMIYSLGRRRQAPPAVMRPTVHGVPRIAVLVSTAVGFLAVIANYFAPADVFKTLLATSGAVALLVYLVIAVSQLRMRSQLEQSDVAIPVRMWAYPYLTWAVVIIIPVMLVYMASVPASQLDLAMTAVITTIVVVTGLLHSRREPAETKHEESQ